MKVIVTGASGFVGKNMTRFFEKNGDEVVPVSLRKNWMLTDSCSAIIHLAGIEKDTGIGTNQDEYFQVNSYLTEKVFQQFLDSEIEDFIFISSCKAVADASDEIVDENTIPNPITPYGKSKLLAEKLISKYELPENKRLIIIRPCLIHGPEDTGNLNLLYKISKKGIPYPFGKFKNQRSYISIDNFGFLILKILKNQSVRSGVYNVADDYPLSTNKLIEIIYKTLGKKPRILNFPTAPINFMAKISAKFGVLFIEEKLNKLTQNYIVSNQKIKTELGIQKLPLSPEEGLEKTIKSFISKK